jgi:hypothetical protein
LITKIQAKKKCQERAMASHRASGTVIHVGNAAAYIIPSPM